MPRRVLEDGELVPVAALRFVEVQGGIYRAGDRFHLPVKDAKELQDQGAVIILLKYEVKNAADI